LVVAPLEQLSLVLVLWPLYRVRGLPRFGSGVLGAVLVALGFGLVDGTFTVATSGRGWEVVATCALVATSGFSAGLWGWTLGVSRHERSRWLPVAWLSATLLRGFVEHLAHGHGPGLLITLVPLGLAAVWAARSFLTKLEGPRESMLPGVELLRELGELAGGPESSARHSRHSMLPEAPSFDQVRAAWQHKHRPALLHWIVLGAAVCFGATLLALAGAVALANGLGLDRSRIDDTDVGAMAPLSLLVVAVLLAFLAAGYLVSRASAADSVFEPGMGALVAIVFLSVLLWMSEPVAGVLSLALAPLAFGLACAGAWLGLERARSRG